MACCISTQWNTIPQYKGMNYRDMQQMDESQMHYAECQKPDSKGYMI